MAVNDNVPISLVPWRLTGASPSTLDVRIDVEDPISWEFGGASPPSFVNPLNNSDRPVLTGYDDLIYRRGTFRLFVPDTEDRDAILEALIAARLDQAAPYFTWQALDGTEQYKVQFDMGEKMTIGYIGPYRTVDVVFVQVAPTVGEPISTTPVVPNPLLPFVTSPQTSMQEGSSVVVNWGNIPTLSPADFIGLFLKSDPGMGSLNQFGRLDLHAKEGSGSLVFSDALSRSPFEIRMYLGVGPRVVIGPTITNTPLPVIVGGPTAGRLTMLDPVDYETRILSGGQQLTVGAVISPDLLDAANDHLLYEYQNQDGSWTQFDSQATTVNSVAVGTLLPASVPIMRTDQMNVPIRITWVLTHCENAVIMLHGMAQPQVHILPPAPDDLPIHIRIGWAGFLPGHPVGYPQRNAFGIATVPDFDAAQVVLTPGDDVQDFFNEVGVILDAGTYYPGRTIYLIGLEQIINGPNWLLRGATYVAPETRTF